MNKGAGQSGVAKRQRKQNDKCLTVIVRHVAAPDAKQRLSRAVSILLSSLSTSNEDKHQRDREMAEHVTKESSKTCTEY